MSESKKVGPLVAYFDTTLDLIQNGHISEEQGKNILTSLEPEFTNKKEIYSYLQYYNTHKFNYWYDFLFDKDEEALDYLNTMPKSQYTSREALTKIIQRFLKMPKKVRKEYYETNFAQIEFSPKNHVDYVILCGGSLPLANPNKIFHNLPTFYLLTHQHNQDMELFENIISDMKKVLKVNDSQFLDTYGNALIHVLENSYIYQNWHYLEMDKRKDFQEAFATKLMYRGTPKYKDFLNLVEKGFLPYDVKYPRGNRYLMSMHIKNELDDVANYFRTTPFSKEDLVIKMQKSKEYMIELNTKYDLYFFDHYILENNSKSMTENFVRYHNSARDKSQFTEIESEILKYQFEIDDIFKKRELKQTKKIKI